MRFQHPPLPQRTIGASPSTIVKPPVPKPNDQSQWYSPIIFPIIQVDLYSNKIPTPVLYIQECTFLISVSPLREGANYAHCTAQYFTLLTITGAVYVLEIPAFYEPHIPSLRSYQVLAENNLIWCRSKYVVVVLQSENPLLFFRLRLSSSPHPLSDVVPKE